MFNDIRKAVKWLWIGVKPNPEDVEPRLIDVRLNKGIHDDLEENLEYLTHKVEEIRERQDLNKR